MPLRLLEFPPVTVWTTGSDANGLWIHLRFAAPGSKFGPVEVVLEADAAEEMASSIIAAIDDFVTAVAE